MNLILFENESSSKSIHESMMQNFPQKPLIEVIGDIQYSNKNSLLSMRPLEEGDAIGFSNPINCNELSYENT